VSLQASVRERKCASVSATTNNSTNPSCTRFAKLKNQKSIKKYASVPDFLALTIPSITTSITSSFPPSTLPSALDLLSLYSAHSTEARSSCYVRHLDKPVYKCQSEEGEMTKVYKPVNENFGEFHVGARTRAILEGREVSVCGERASGDPQLFYPNPNFPFCPPVGSVNFLRNPGTSLRRNKQLIPPRNRHPLLRPLRKTLKLPPRVHEDELRLRCKNSNHATVGELLDEGGYYPTL